MMKFAVLVMVLMLAVGEAVSGETKPIVYQKTLPDGTVCTVKTSTWVEKWEKVKDSLKTRVQGENDWKLAKDLDDVFPVDFHMEKYEMTLRKGSKTEVAVWEKVICAHTLNPGTVPKDSMRRNDNLDIYDVVLKGDKVAVLFSDFRDVDVVLVGKNQEGKYVVTSTHKVSQRFESNTIEEGKMAWLEDDLFVLLRRGTGGGGATGIWWLGEGLTRKVFLGTKSTLPSESLESIPRGELPK
jgi:hypothetical protein